MQGSDRTFTYAPSFSRLSFPYPGNTWHGEIKCRVRGAIGIFEWRYFVTRAEPDNVILWLLDVADMDGYEIFQGPRNIMRIDHRDGPRFL